MIQICYTNSNTSDVWDMFYEQSKKYCSYPLYLISDELHKNKVYDGIHIYENSQPYWLAWAEALKKIQSDFFIYLQEDFILYDSINEEKIKEYEKFLNQNPKYSFVRLLRSGSLNKTKLTDSLFDIESGNKNIFSMQPTIWRTSDFIKLYKHVAAPKWFENDTYIEKCIKLNLKGAYHYDNEPKRGLDHYDSNVYPYIATALVRGKWNISEYKDELKSLLNEYNIDINIRGTL